MSLLLFSKLLCQSAESGKRLWLGREQRRGLKVDLAHGFSHQINFAFQDNVLEAQANFAEPRKSPRRR